MFPITERSFIVASNLSFVLLASAASTPTNSTLWPSGRGGHVLVYDEARGETLLIGGDASTPSQTRDSVWAWNGVTWRVSDAPGPTWRTLPAASFDRRNGRVILQGGRTKTGATQYSDVAEGDTWAWSGTAWEKLDVGSPGPLDHHAIVYDVQRGVHVIQGGADGGKMLPGDTWTFDGKAWSKAATAASGPGQRVHHAMAYDSRRVRTVLFGGFGEDGDGRSGETWEWDGTRWERVATTGPSPRSRHRLAYDVARGVTIMFGGNDDPKTWAWDGQTWRTVAESGPSPRGMHAMAYDSRRERVVLYGGGEQMSDLWEWDGKEWREIKRASE